MICLCWLFLITFLSSICLDMVSRRICSMTLSGPELRLAIGYFPGFSFLHFLKMGIIFLFLQSLRTLADCHDFSNVMKCGLVTASASSLRTLECILLGHMDLCVFLLFRWSHTWISPMMGGTSILQSLLWVEYLSLVHISCHQIPASFIVVLQFLLSSISEQHICRSTYYSHPLPNLHPAVPYISWVHSYTPRLIPTFLPWCMALFPLPFPPCISVWPWI